MSRYAEAYHQWSLAQADGYDWEGELEQMAEEDDPAEWEWSE